MIAVQIYDSGAVIHIHDDFCCHVCSEDVPEILAQIGMLVSGAYLKQESGEMGGETVS